MHLTSSPDLVAGSKGPAWYSVIAQRVSISPLSGFSNPYFLYVQAGFPELGSNACPSRMSSETHISQHLSIILAQWKHILETVCAVSVSSKELSACMLSHFSCVRLCALWASLVNQLVKNPPAMRET